MLTQTQQERFARQLMLEQVGIAGQEKLQQSKVLIVGAGGLGSPVAWYLTAAGVGTIGIVDDDCVDLSNLQRQILHTAADLGKPKTASAQAKLSAQNPDVQVIPYAFRLTEENAEEIFSHYDIIVDATDNFTTKFLINDICVKMQKPFVHGGIVGFQGQLFTYVPNSPCYRCLFQAPPPEPNKPGVVGPTCGIIGSLQAMEVLKYLLQTGELLTGRLLICDGLTMKFREVKFPKSKSCICE